MKNQSIDDRMKENYEIRNRRYLTRRTPVIIRIDGKAFHTYTRGLVKPFDIGLISDMQQTMLYLCQNIQGCKFGYCQSDEISLLLADYDTLQTDAWFDYCQNKIESVAASMATAKFNQLRTSRFIFENKEFNDSGVLFSIQTMGNDKLAIFDARAMNIPKEEVVNYFVWRQQDATKNSISMLAQSLYSHKELQGKNSSQLQELCYQKGINWNDLPTVQKRGTACYTTVGKKDLTEKVPIEKLKQPFWEEDGKYGIFTELFELDFNPLIFSTQLGRGLLDMLI